MISILVPAHNEETVIARGLRAMLTRARPGELQIIVACNGCMDRTADIARAFGPPVRVLEIAQASKTAALNAAEKLATGFPRFYVDADVLIDLTSIRAMADTLNKGAFLFANPSLEMDLSKTSWPVRAFYRVWTALPYNNSAGMVGTGVFALTHAARARFAEFPNIIADDAFVRYCFCDHERVRVDDAISQVEPPRTLSELITIKTRSRLGGYQLRARSAKRTYFDRKHPFAIAYTLLRDPSLWTSVPVYLFVNVLTRIRARHHLRNGRLKWERDGSRARLPTCFTSPPSTSRLRSSETSAQQGSRGLAD